MSKKKNVPLPAPKKYRVWISIGVGNGQYQQDEQILEGDEGDCESAIWDMLNNNHVETGWEEVEE